jgi:hypothetical protein
MKSEAAAIELLNINGYQPFKKKANCHANVAKQRRCWPILMTMKKLHWLAFVMPVVMMMPFLKM